MTWKRKIGGKKMERKRKDKTNNMCFSVWRGKKKGRRGRISRSSLTYSMIIFLWRSPKSMHEMNHVLYFFRVTSCAETRRARSSVFECFCFVLMDQEKGVYSTITTRIFDSLSKKRNGWFSHKTRHWGNIPVFNGNIIEIWNMKYEEPPPRRTERVFYLHSPPRSWSFPPLIERLHIKGTQRKRKRARGSSNVTQRLALVRG